MATTAPVNSATSTQTQAVKTSNPKGQLKVEDFINMMVTQLQNQDPMDPAKSDQLLSQMSEIGQLQSQQSLQTSLTTLVQQNNIGSASNLIGKTVDGLDSTSGSKITGKVQSVLVQSGNVVLKLDSGVTLPMSQISSITQPESDIAAAVKNSAGATVAP